MHWAKLTFLLFGIFAKSSSKVYHPDEDTENLIYSMSKYLKMNPNFQADQEIKWAELGYVGGAITEIYVHKHCSMKNGYLENIPECFDCFTTDYENTTKMIQCTKDYLPEEYHSCWKNDSKDNEILQCWKEAMKKVEYKNCLTQCNIGNGGCQSLNQMEKVKNCLARKKETFQMAIYGEVLNRMFGKCGANTFMALLQMIPGPFKPLKAQLDIEENYIKEFIKGLYSEPKSELDSKHEK